MDPYSHFNRSITAPKATETYETVPYYNRRYLYILEIVLNVLITLSGLVIILWNIFGKIDRHENYIIGAALIKTGVAGLVHIANSNATVLRRQNSDFGF